MPFYCWHFSFGITKRRSNIKLNSHEKVHRPLLVIIGFFALIYAILASTDRTTQIALFGAAYSALLVAIYAFIPAIKNPNYSMWWSLPDDVTPGERWGFYIGNFLVCGAISISSFQLPQEHLSEMSIAYFAIVPVVVTLIAVWVRTIMLKHNK